MPQNVYSTATFVGLSRRKGKRYEKKSDSKRLSHACICSGSPPGEFESRRMAVGIDALPAKQHLENP